MTTIALLSDVHGNVLALREVLGDIARRGADVVVDLGDIASGGVDPRATLDVFRSEGGRVQHVRGNHERQVLEPDVERMGLSDRLAHAVLTGDDRQWLAALPTRISPADGVLAFHACPDDDLQYLLHTVTPAGVREASDAEIVERLGSHAGRYELFACGHTHLQGDRRLPDGSLVVNPGSVGWPAYDDDLPHPHVMEAGSPHARYSLVTRTDGAWQVTHVALEYDVDAAAATAGANGRADVAYALRHGRVGS